MMREERALLSYQCGPGSNPGTGFKSEPTLLSVLVLGCFFPLVQGFFMILRFSSLHKNQPFPHSNPLIISIYLFVSCSHPI